MTAEPLTPEQVEQWRSNPANDLLGPLFATLDAARAEVASHNEIILAQGDTIARMRNEQADMQLEFGAEVERLTVELDAAVKMLGRIGEAAGPPHGDRNVTLATVQRMRPVVEAARAALEWRGLDGDGISDPVRQQLVDALDAAEGK